MADLVAALVCVVLPWLSLTFGAADIGTASVAIAGILIWPGYVVARWLWPREDQLAPSQKLAFIPLLSLLVFVGVGLLTWSTLQQATPGVVSTFVAISMMALSVVVALSRSRHHRTREQTLREFGDALAMFIAVSALIGLVVSAPAERANLPTLTVYLDPESSIERVGDRIDLPLLITHTGSASTATFGLTAEVAGQVVAEQRIGLKPDARTRIGLSIPITILSATPTPVDIRIQSDDPGSARRLRVWLDAAP